MNNHSVSLQLLIAIFLLMGCNTLTVPKWKEENDKLIAKYNLEPKELRDTKNKVKASSEAGKKISFDSMKTLELYPGVNANFFWGNGALVNILTLEPNSIIAREELPESRFLIMVEGTIELSDGNKTKKLVAIEREEADGTHSGTPRTDFIFQKRNSVSEIRAGELGAQLVEVYNPVRLDYLEKLGISSSVKSTKTKDAYLEPSIVPNKIYDLYDIQLSKISEGAFSRIVSAGNMQLSFVSLQPNTTARAHIHPEEQLTFVQRGSLEQMVVGEEHALKTNDAIYVAGNMVHSSKAGEVGADMMDVFVPIREDYVKKQEDASKRFLQIIPKNAKLELLIDGSEAEPHLTFSEGPKWLNGKVYFSNMYFDENWNADPKKSSIVEMSGDGSLRNISQGKMQTNGLYPYKNGNLLVCDMIGHRVLEMTTTGEIVRVIVDSYNGKPIDGPNDIITDSKGGIYFTDPQFTMEAEKFQPGRAVYYVSNKGVISRITSPNEFAMPNGILLSPDGKTLYINNCYDDESWYPVDSDKENFIWAYDVYEDGTISNGRKFAELLLTDNVLERKGKSSSADGMAIDKNGNIYVATYYGVQIFDAKGSFVGMINLPSFPVSLCFGDKDMKTLYIVSYDKVFKIRTNMEGYINYL
ncbi:SMP-30/gluconolactonase/LRE family protein [Euzebyella saccharophila]|uniref:SMP-30/gluconolactonase/LRE family protein n=1 Tax=Euzebyella saccharophila TaxID=679664 RepID=A0ABV8JMC9_9FLAO|nr:SMP-30/gluconolactonase/LRE family protein [Euzebyella saccharophila]